MATRPTRIAAWIVWAIGGLVLLPGSVGWVLMWTALWLVVIAIFMFVHRVRRTE